jgi:uncharacterized protein YabE (DUF348 family)/3D (Asp-Asp-Asp) domain-containing protein
MYRRRISRKQRLQLAVLAAAGVAALALCVAIAMRVFAREIPVVVEDWEKTYSFSMSGLGRDPLDSILNQAQAQGMEPLGPLDLAELGEDGRTVALRRGVELYVRDGEESAGYTAYKGDTVEEALAENGLWLKEADQVAPNREMVIAAPLTVEITRLLRVNIVADGETTQVKVSGGTVADALEEAGVKLSELDSCNHELTEPVKDDMLVEVSRVVSVRIAVDGSTRGYRVQALTVEGALEKVGVTLGKEDRVEPEPQTTLRTGMKITVRRVKTQEETETEEIDYERKYVHTRDLVEGETSVLTEGMKGKKELRYRAVYVDGELESRELLSEEVVAEPVKEIVLRGSGYQTQAPQLDFIDDGSSSSPSPTSKPGDTGNSGQGISVNTTAGTLTDQDGKQVRYSRAITGECTAYCIPGGTTSVGLLAERGIIAVDPDIIPYGTKMFVASPDGSIVYGYGVAGDTGGACLAGDIIADLCYDTIEECSIIGRRDMVLYILE